MIAAAAGARGCRSIGAWRCMARRFAIERGEDAGGEIGRRGVIAAGAADEGGEPGRVVARIAARVAAGEVLGVAGDRVAITVDKRR
jgi:hypothetical protein